MSDNPCADRLFAESEAMFDAVELACQQIPDRDTESVLRELAEKLGKQQAFERLSSRDIKRLSNKFSWARTKVEAHIARCWSEFVATIAEIEA
jgi:primosomal protein N''